MDLVTRGMLACGVTNAVDGSDDDAIHCFKNDQPAAAGLARLKEIWGEGAENEGSPADDNEMEDGDSGAEGDDSDPEVVVDNGEFWMDVE